MTSQPLKLMRLLVSWSWEGDGARTTHRVLVNEDREDEEPESITRQPWADMAGFKVGRCGSSSPVAAGLGRWRSVSRTSTGEQLAQGWHGESISDFTSGSVR